MVYSLGEIIEKSQLAFLERSAIYLAIVIGFSLVFSIVKAIFSLIFMTDMKHK